MGAAALVAFLALWGCSSGAGPEAAGEADCGPGAGEICTWAGDGEAGWDGDGHAPAASSFYWPVDLTITPAGQIYILDWNNHRVRHLRHDGRLETVIGSDFVGDGPYDAADQQPPGAPGTEVYLNHPTHLLPLADGTLLLSSWHNHKLRLYDPGSGLVQVVCGAGAGYAGDGGPARQALLNQPQQCVLSPDGSWLVLDQRNQRVRRISAAGTISTVVGIGTAGGGGDGGSPLLAQLDLPTGSNPPPGGAIALGPDGVLYISDTLNHRIRRVDFAADRIETVAGTGVAGFGGDGGPARDAALNNPRDLALGPDGRLYVADELNHRVRAIDLAGGTIETVAGTGVEGFGGDGGPAREALLNRPAGLEFDPQGRLYIADTYNHRIRRVNP